MCLSSGVFCDPPHVPPYSVVTNVTTLEYGGQVTYACAPGYKLVGNVTLTCGQDGWGPLPECQGK